MDRHVNIVPDGHSLFQTVEVDRDGIRLFGLLYNGPELELLRSDADATFGSVTAAVDPANGERALAIIPNTFELVELALVSQANPSSVPPSTTSKRLCVSALRSSVAASVFAACERVVALPRSWGREQ